jgi:hypothetical protein
MKQGKTFEELTQELDRRSAQKKDWTVRGEGVQVHTNEGNTRMHFSDGEKHELGMLNLAHNQLAERLDMPSKYYDTIRKDYPELFDHTINYLLPAKHEKHLVRTLDGNVRAVKSPRFRILDDLPFLKAVLPPLVESGFQLASCEVTDTRLYVKVVSDKLTAEPKLGQPIRAGFCFRNSEVGFSRLAGNIFAEVLACTNGMISSKEYGFARNHAGKELELSEVLAEYITDETRAKEDAAYWAAVTDSVSGMVKTKEGFEGIILKITEATQKKISGDPVAVIDNLAKAVQLTLPEKTGVLTHFLQAADFTAWGLSSAVTRYSQDVEDYDRATDFEALGGRIIELPKRDWDAIAIVR